MDDVGIYIITYKDGLLVKSKKVKVKLYGWDNLRDFLEDHKFVEIDDEFVNTNCIMKFKVVSEDE